MGSNSVISSSCSILICVCEWCPIAKFSESVLHCWIHGWFYMVSTPTGGYGYDALYCGRYTMYLYPSKSNRHTDALCRPDRKHNNHILCHVDTALHVFSCSYHHSTSIKWSTQRNRRTLPQLLQLPLLLLQLRLHLVQPVQRHHQ